MLTVIQIQLLSRNITSSFKTLFFFLFRSRSPYCEDQREVTAKIKVVLFRRNDMTCDARRNRHRDSVVIFEIMIIFLNKIQVQV